MEFSMALGGGGVKGGAEIGVLRALWEKNIYPSAMSGTSIGGIIAGLYGFGFTPDQLDALATDVSENGKELLDIGYGKVLSSALLMMSGKAPTIEGIIEGDKLENFLCTITANCDISELLFPIAITTVDVDSGEIVVFYSQKQPDFKRDDVVYIGEGKLGSIMRATSAIPGVFAPMQLAGRTLVDGGVKMNLPLELAFGLGYDKVIGVDLKEANSTKPAKNIMTIFTKSINLMGNEISQIPEGELLVIAPKVYTGEGILDFSVIPLGIAQGYRETVHLMPLIKQMLSIR